MADRSDRSDPGVRESGSLPAPYANPWSSLAQDLRAVSADVRLRLQELWRRNREGDLSTPGIWPRDLAPLFWPLVLVLPVLLLAAGVMQWQRLHPEPPPPPQVEQLTTTPLPEARLLPEEPAAERPFAPDLPISTDTETQGHSEPAQELVPDPQAALPRLDPLLQFLATDDPGGLILAAEPQLSQNSVRLLVSDDWLDWPQARRQALAESWWERLKAEGFSALTIESSDQHLLARTARVGNGMILFNVEDR
jgi:hypothetical protein